MNTWLQNLKDGDSVIINSDGWVRPGKVSRVTPAQIMVGENRFRISDGRLIGGGKWARSWLMEATPDVVASINERAERNQLINRLASQAWIGLTTDQLRRVASALYGVKEE